MKTKTKSALWIGVSCFIAYMAFYLGKTVVSAVKPHVEAGSELTTTLGLMLSAFMLSYGVGQLVNGVIGNRIDPKWMIFFGLVGSGTAVFLLPFFAEIQVAAVASWVAFGFVGSMLWGPICRRIGDNTDHETGKVLLTAMASSSLAGKLLTHAVTIFATSTGGWKMAFYLCGASMIAAGGLWMLADIHMTYRGYIRRSEPLPKEAREKTGGSVRYFFNAGFITMVIVVMLVSVIRNAVGDWLPSFMTVNLGIDENISNVLSIVFQIVNALGTFVSLWLLRFTKNNEKILCAILFGVSALSFAVLYFLGKLFIPGSIFFIALTGAAMEAAESLVFSVYVLRFRASGKISGITGFFDFSAYAMSFAVSMFFTFDPSWNTIVIGVIAAMALGVFLSLISNRCRADRIWEHEE